MIRTVNILVSGKVQGVYFRFFAQKQARKLGVSGWVRNLASGEVEIVAQGENAALEEMMAWSHKGSLFAKVKHVKITELSESERFSSFEIKADAV